MSRSAAAEQYRRWYYTAAWRQLRADQLRMEPWCGMCADMGRQTPATIADHRQPHRGDPGLFFNPHNLASLCTTHHSATKQRQERGRVTIAVSPDGWPVRARAGQA
jgi:5-methylcytosine-specific restriction endonuclease McrA